VGKTSEENGGVEEIRTNAILYNGRGLVEMIREPEYIKDRGTTNRPVLPVRVAGTVETVVLGRVVRDGGRVLFGGRLLLWWRYGLLVEERSPTGKTGPG